jgi:hypothetical protein
VGVRSKVIKKRIFIGLGVDVVDLEPSSKIWFIRVKKIFHPFEYMGRDILKSSMIDPMFSSISSQRKFVLDVIFIHNFTQPQQNG